MEPAQQSHRTKKFQKLPTSLGRAWLPLSNVHLKDEPTRALQLKPGKNREDFLPKIQFPWSHCLCRHCLEFRQYRSCPGCAVVARKHKTDGHDDTLLPILCTSHGQEFRYELLSVMRSAGHLELFLSPHANSGFLLDSSPLTIPQKLDPKQQDTIQQHSICQRDQKVKGL